MTTRRVWLQSLAAGGAACLLGPRLAAANERQILTVYKSPTCGCCEEWAEYMEANDFAVNMVDVEDVDAIKQRLNIPRELYSCHTASVQGYAIEGHVPADLIRKLIREKARAAGIAVPGMRAGTPGMEQGTQKEKYTVFIFDSAGKIAVYATR
jgi:hypothetical protein